MSRAFIVVTLSSLVLIGVLGFILYEPIHNTFAIKKGDCKSLDYLWSHTYGAGYLVHGETTRLKELSPECVVFDGVVTSLNMKEGDGDLHILLTPDDKDDMDLLNSDNKGKLTAEVICWETPGKSYTDKWPGFCDGVDSRKHIPALNVGDHVRITGKWVQDIGYPTPDHAPWNEIHPVESIQKLN